jgi:trehalose-6-phosphate synthase
LAQLVIVSNRVAIPEKNAKARAGGLEVAVKAALKHKSGIWFGWSGKVATRTKIATQRVLHDGITYITLDLSKEDHQEYYNDFTNRVLWPILHYRVDLAEFSRRDLSGYLRVNDHFARELHEVLGPDDLVWVHDYHLIPLAKALRERGHRNRIGFFLHIPCPPPEILTALPNHERLIPSLCEYDLVGFQTSDDAVATHLVMSFGQTLLHYKVAHHPIGGKLFRNHINFHHTHYADDHLVSRTYLGDEGNITPYFLIPVFLVGGCAYFLLPLNLFVVAVIASAASFYAHVFFDKEYHVEGSRLQRFAWFRGRFSTKFSPR